MSCRALIDLFVAWWEGRDTFFAQTHLLTFRGNPIHGLLGVTVPCHAETLDLTQVQLTLTGLH